MPHPTNAQIAALKEKLRATGFGLEITNQFAEPGSSRQWTRYRTYHTNGRAVFFVVVDLGIDGYSLLIEQPGIRIDDDVMAILNAATAAQVPA